MQTADALRRIRAFVTENFLYLRPDFPLADDDRLLGRGVIDSMGILELISFLTEEFGIEIADEDITEANLGTLQALARFVATRLAPDGSEVFQRAEVD
jgi:acyl carrier protein